MVQSQSRSTFSKTVELLGCIACTELRCCPLLLVCVSDCWAEPRAVLHAKRLNRSRCSYGSVKSGGGMSYVLGGVPHSPGEGTILSTSGSSVRDILLVPKLFPRWQQRCGLLLSVGLLQQLVCDTCYVMIVKYENLTSVSCRGWTRTTASCCWQVDSQCDSDPRSSQMLST